MRQKWQFRSIVCRARGSEWPARAHILAAESQNLHSNLTIDDCAQSTYKIQAIVSEFSKI